MRPTTRLAAVVAFLALGGALCAAAAEADETERLGELLGLYPGAVLADVGAGKGEWSERLAPLVGETGRVFATEIDEELLTAIRERAEQAERANLTVVAGGEESTGLPRECCDAILLRMVYHHFTDPAPMRRSLAAALRPGGRMVVCEIEPRSSWPELAEVPDRGGHGISPEQLVAEMAGDGFREIERRERWNGESARYCVVFAEGP